MSVPSSTSEEDFTSDTLDTALTLEAKTGDVKKVWLREIRRKTERLLEEKEEEGASQQVLVMLMLIADECDGNPC